MLRDEPVNRLRTGDDQLRDDQNHDAMKNNNGDFQYVKNISKVPEGK
jgi:hypothetical protein